MSGTDDTSSAGPALIGAELGLLVVGLATAAACSRLFLDWDFMATLGSAVAASWMVAVLTRRANLGVAASAAISMLVAILAMSWVFAPETTTVGLPTPSTAQALADEMHTSFSAFSRLVAPVEASEGFLVVLAAVMWAFAWFVDVAAIRYRGPVQAVIPYISVFVAVGVLSRDSGRTGAALAFGAGLAVYAVSERVLTASRWHWPAGGYGRGLRAVAATSSLVVAVALGVGIVVGPLLPGDTKAVVDLRSMGRGGGTRTVVSPFVGVRTLLGPQSDQVVFSVRSPVPAYWRLTALGRYDPTRDIWVSQGTYQEVDNGRLDDPSQDDRRDRPRVTAPAEPVLQAYEVDGLGGPWVPAAFVPRSIDGDIDVSYDAATSSIITRGGDLATGDRFAITSEVRPISAADLNSSRRRDPVPSSYLDTTGVSGEVSTAARRATIGQTTPYQQALALQNWFRDGFEYRTDVDYRADADPVAAFLQRREGFCQQFASAYALMARSLGLPARVAVGFTQGDQMQAADGSITYVVRGRHAHTWPEVHFDGIGWVAFEPTTGRGNPQAVDYTGVQPAQAEAPPEGVTTTTSTTTTQVTDDAGATSTVPSGQVDAVGAGGSDSSRDSGAPLWTYAVLIIVAVTLVSASRVIGRRRRRLSALRRDPGGGGRVAAAWAGALMDLAALGLVPDRWETPLEFAARVSADGVFDPPTTAAPSQAGGTDHRVEDDPADIRTVPAALRLLAGLETARRYAPGRSGDGDCDATTGGTDLIAERAAGQIHSAVRAATSARRRAGQLVSLPG